jgi:hypothetical protein
VGYIHHRQVKIGKYIHLDIPRGIDTKEQQARYQYQYRDGLP